MLAYGHSSVAHRAKLPSTNPIERRGGEVARRTGVLAVVPNLAVAVGLAGAILKTVSLWRGRPHLYDCHTNDEGDAVPRNRASAP